MSDTNIRTSTGIADPHDPSRSLGINADRSITAQLAAGTNTIGATIGLAYGGTQVSVTRPNNTTPYTAGNVVGGVITFTNMGPSGGRVMLTSSQLEWDVSAIPSGATSFTLYLYNVTPPSALADGAAFDLPSGDRDAFLGLINLGTPVDLGATCYCEQNIINKQIKLAGTSLFAYAVTTAGYTPAAQTVQRFTLHTIGLGL